MILILFFIHVYLKHKWVVLFKNYEGDHFANSVDTDLRNRGQFSAGLEGFLTFIRRENVRSRKPPLSLKEGVKFFKVD
jgi:hypothetical protein